MLLSILISEHSKSLQKIQYYHKTLGRVNETLTCGFDHVN